MKKRYILTLGIGVTALLLLIVFVQFPYMPQILKEGYPKRVWPAQGAFTELQGSSQSPEISATGDIGERSKELFEERGGEVLIVSHANSIKLAHYAEGVSPDTKFNSYSMAKSIVGALVLRAVADGKISDIDDPIGNYLPELGDQRLRQLPLSDFVHMRTGIAVEKPSLATPGSAKVKDMEVDRFSPFSPMVKLHVLGPEAIWHDIKVNQPNGKPFNYQNTNTAILGVLLEKLYDKPLQTTVSELIWQPAGAGTAYWRRYNETSPVTPYCCIYATASDWLQVATFLLANGEPENPLLPQREYDLLFGKNFSQEERFEGTYGYQNYHNLLDRDGEKLQGDFSYFMGSRGQSVFFVPDKDLIVVRFGDGLPLIHSTLYAAWDHIEPQ